MRRSPNALYPAQYSQEIVGTSPVGAFQVHSVATSHDAPSSVEDAESSASWRWATTAIVEARSSTDANAEWQLATTAWDTRTQYVADRTDDMSSSQIQ